VIVQYLPFSVPQIRQLTTAPVLNQPKGLPNPHQTGPAPLHTAAKEVHQFLRKPGPGDPADEFPATGKYPGPLNVIAGDFSGRNRHEPKKLSGRIPVAAKISRAQRD